MDNITFLLNIKLYALKRSGMEYLTFSQLKDMLYHTKWLTAVPNQLNKQASDIDSLTANEVAEYITNKKIDTTMDIKDLEVNENEEY